MFYPNLWRRTAIFLSVGFACLFSIGSRADHILATFSGSPQNLYSDPANWAPTVVPVNGGGNTFDVELLDHWVFLDIDATINNISGSQHGYLVINDHKFTATQSSNLSTVYIQAQVVDAAVDLGTFAQYLPATNSFLGDTISATAFPSRTATLQFNGADIVNNAGSISLLGAGARIADENGNDALRHLSRSTSLSIGHQLFTTAGDFTNDGQLALGGSIDASQPSTLRINGNLTNFDKASRTLQSGQYSLYGDSASLATLSFNDADIVNLAASISFNYSNQQIVDQLGSDALRNLVRITPTGSLTLNRTGRVINGDFTNEGLLYLGNDLPPLNPPFAPPPPMFIINGNLTNVVNGTLTGGIFKVTGGVGLRFNDANILANATDLTVGGGPVTDQFGNSAFRNFAHNLPGGSLTLWTGTLTTNANFTNDGIVTVGVPPGQVTLTRSGTFNILGGGTTTNAGALTIGGYSKVALTASATYRQTLGGSTTIDNGTLAAGFVNLQSGSLIGRGVIQADVTSDALIAPRGYDNRLPLPYFLSRPHGRLTIEGGLTLTRNAQTTFAIGGTTAAALDGYDALAIADAAVLDGSLVVSLDSTLHYVSTINPDGTATLTLVRSPLFLPSPSDAFALLTAFSLSGQFDNAPDGSRLTDVDGYGTFLVSYVPDTNGNGYSVLLSDFQSVPEPVAPAFALIISLLCLRRTRRPHPQEKTSH